MAKVISFEIKLAGSQKTISKINEIGKALENALKNAGLQVDGKALDELAKSTETLKKGAKEAGVSISDITKRMSALRAEGKQNTEEYQALTLQVAKLKNEQTQNAAAIKRAQKALEDQANLQRLLNGEIKATDLSQKKFLDALNSGLDKADPKYQELIDSFSRLKAEEQQLREGLRQQQRAFEAAGFAAGSYRQLNAELVNLRRSYKELSAEERNGATGQAALARIQELDRELRRLDADVGQFQRNVGNYASAWKGVSGALAAVGVTAGLSELASVVKKTIGDFADFEAQVKAVQIVTGATDEQIKILEADARRLGATTRFTAKEVAGLQENFARLGFSPDEIVAATAATLDLAIATGEDLPASAEVAAGTLRGYGLQAAETERVTNVMADSFSKSALNLEKFRESQKLVAPLAAQLNLSLEATTAAFGKLADNQISGSLAGTSLRTILADLGDENSKLAKFLGVSVNSTEDFVIALQKLRDANLDTAKARELVGRQSFVTLLSLKANADGVNELTKQLENSSTAYAKLANGSIVPLTEELKNSGKAYEVVSAGQRAAAIASDTLSGDLATLRSTIAEVGLKFGEATQGGIRGFLQFLTTAIPLLVEYTSLIVKLGVAIGLLVLRQKALTAAQVEGSLAAKAYGLITRLLAGEINILSKATNGASNAVKGLTKAFLKNPILFIVGLVAGLIIAISELAKRNETVRLAFQEVGEALKRLAQIFQPVIDAFKRVFAAIGEGVSRLGLMDKLVKVLTVTAKVLAEAIDFVVAVFTGLAQAAKDAYERFGLVRSIVDSVRNTFNRFIELISNIPAVFAGISAAAQQVATNIARFFQRITLQAELLQTKLQLAVTFDDDKEADLRAKIESIRQQKADFEAEGKTVGQAFNEAFAKAVEEKKAIEAKAEIDNKQVEKEAKQKGNIAGEQYGEGFAEGTKKAEKKALEARKKALENIAKIESGLIQNEFDAKVTVSTQGAAADISGLVGDPEQIRKQAALIKSTLALSLGEIEQSRALSFKEVIDRARQSAANEIALLTGSPNEIAINTEIIRQSLVTNLEKITTTQQETIQKSIQQAEESKAKEISSLTGTPEEIAANTAIIENAYSTSITRLKETQKQIITESELEVNNLRKEINKEFEGEIVAELQTASAAELEAIRDNIRSRLALYEAELEQKKNLLRQTAELNKQRLITELEGGVSPARAKVIAAELEKIDKDLKDKLLAAEQKSAQDRLAIIAQLVPGSLKAAQEIADAEVAINAEKNAKILAQEKARAELEKEIKKSAVDAAFEIAGAAINAQFERDRQRIDEEEARKQENSEAVARGEKAKLEETYNAQIQAAQGSATEQERLRAELASKIILVEQRQAAREDDIAREQGKKKQNQARKEALINGAVAATKALASLGLPAAIPALIAIAASVIAQLATIGAQRFAEGGALSNGMEDYIISTYEAGGSLGNTESRGIDISKSSSAALPVEGIISGPSHASGGIGARFGVKPINVEGGEYKLKNGAETYIINKSSTRANRSALEALKGNPDKFSARKRVAAAAINAYAGRGVRFGDGGILGADLKPLPAPIRLRDSRGGVTTAELSAVTSGLYAGFQDVARRLDEKTDSIAQASGAQLAAINARIDRLKVIADPKELANVAAEIKKTESIGEL